MPYLPATNNCRQLFCTDVVIWSYTTVPVALRLPFLPTIPVHFTNFQVQERYLPIIREAQERRFLASQATLTIDNNIHCTHFLSCYSNSRNFGCGRLRK